MFEQPENENAKIIEQDQTIFIVYLLLRKKHVWLPNSFEKNRPIINQPENENAKIIE